MIKNEDKSQVRNKQPLDAAQLDTSLLNIKTVTIVKVLESNREQHIVSATIDSADIDPQAIEVTHSYGLDKARYEGIGHVALGMLTKWPYVWLHLVRLCNAIGQRRFNSRPLVIGERLDILRDVVDATAHGTDAVDALGLMSYRYGYRWACHSDWQNYLQRLDKQLALLAESGDLATSDHFKYRPTGAGVRTLDERTDAARKHVANWGMQVASGIVALAALVFTAAQTGFLTLPTVLDLQEKKEEQLDKTNAHVVPGTGPATAAKTLAPESLPSGSQPEPIRPVSTGVSN